MKKRRIFCFMLIGLVVVFVGCGTKQENNLAVVDQGKDTISSEKVDNEKMASIGEKEEEKEVALEETGKEEKKEAVEEKIEEENVVQEAVTEEKKEEEPFIQEKETEEKREEWGESVESQESKETQDVILEGKNQEQMITAVPDDDTSHLTPTQEALLKAGNYKVIENASGTGYAVMVPVGKSDYGYQLLQEYLIAMDCESKDLSGGMLDEEHYMCVALQIVPLVTMEDEEFWN